MAGIARPFIPWIGSKEKLIPYIWQVFPSSPKLYLEPFGGGGALLLGMQPKVSRISTLTLLEAAAFGNVDCTVTITAYRDGKQIGTMQTELVLHTAYLWPKEVQ